ncbi:MAG TPA: sugar transferase [Alphaproteobacteria bacterium]|nr:sugar transferase [Alphaproteobacteria bacterium]
MTTLSLKRGIDVAAALILLVVTAPLMLVVAIVVALALGRPVLFRQQRVGKGDRLFMLYKFRSMSNAQDGQGALLGDGERLTAFGKLLRATSLDELPELWNILKGDMSLVGPRPLLPEYLPYYSETQRLRHRMRPGLTGFAQVKGRNAIGWEERLALDAWYVQHWSLSLDFRIAAATLKTVLSRHGVQPEGLATMPRFDDYMIAQRQTAMADKKQ